MRKKNLPDIEIIELFLVKCGNDFTRTYMAQLRREYDINGNQIICGVVEIEGWKIWSSATTEEELGINLDAICEQVLKQDNHNQFGKSMPSYGPELSHN